MQFHSPVDSSSMSSQQSHQIIEIVETFLLIRGGKESSQLHSGDYESGIKSVLGEGLDTLYDHEIRPKTFNCQFCKNNRFPSFDDFSLQVDTSSL
jgi:hypothetical protein